MYSQLVDYSTRMSTRIPYNVATKRTCNNAHLTTAASGDITEKINCYVYCLPLMLGSPERDFTIVTRLAHFAGYTST